MLLALVLVSTGFVWGFVLGRWWALIPSVARGSWAAFSIELEAVPGWYVGLVYGVLSSLGIAAGVLLRRRFARRT
jgi:hypothetical protein